MKPAVAGGEAIAEERRFVVGLRIRTGGSERACSGVLLAPRLVMTAKHCIDRAPLDKFQCTDDGELTGAVSSTSYFVGDVEPGEISVRRGGADAVPVSGSRILSHPGNNPCKGDLAFVVLAQELNVTPAAVRLGPGTAIGTQVTVAGWGLDELGRLRDEPWERSDVTILANNEDLAAAVPATPYDTFVVGPSVCDGDSGGPAILQGANVALGVYSRRNASTCVSPQARNTFTRLSAARGFLREAFLAAGAAPMLEGRSTPGFREVGEACTADLECDQERCDSATKRCARPCGGDAECSAGETCVAQGSTSLCRAPTPGPAEVPPSVKTEETTTPEELPEEEAPRRTPRACATGPVPPSSSPGWSIVGWSVAAACALRLRGLGRRDRRRPRG